MQLIEAINKATEEDLEQVQEQVDKLSRDLDAMKSIQKILKAKFGKNDPVKYSRRKSTGRATKSEPSTIASASNHQMSPLAEQVFDLIEKEGPIPIDVIARKLGKDRPQGVAAMISKTDWFMQLPTGDIAIARNE